MLNITKENINSLIEENNIIVLDFWAPWCGPCRTYGPIFEKVSKKYDDILFGKVNVDEEPELSAFFKIRGIPSTAIIKNKEVIFFRSGMIDEIGLDKIIEEL